MVQHINCQALCIGEVQGMESSTLTTSRFVGGYSRFGEQVVFFTLSAREYTRCLSRTLFQGTQQTFRRDSTCIL